jgi:hypothetical protein
LSREIDLNTGVEEEDMGLEVWVQNWLVICRAVVDPAVLFGLRVALLVFFLPCYRDADDASFVRMSLPKLASLVILRLWIR